MDETWMMRGAAGGALIGVSASVVLLLAGRVTGISGILNTLMQKADPAEHTWRALFVVGLLLGGLGASALLPAVSVTVPSLGVAIVAGVLVGVGTRLGNGCTSGHGVCGLSRFSVRSLAATLTFIATGALGVLVQRGLAAGVAE